MALDLGLDDDQREIEGLFGHFFDRESTSFVVREAEPLGFDRGLWDRIRTLGASGMGVPDPETGGGRFADLVVVCEALGRCVAPIPLCEHLVASRLLRDDDVLAGERIATLALHPADADGVFKLVPAGAVADTVIGLDGDELVAVSSSAPGHGPINHGSAPMADRSAREGVRRTLGGAREFALARDEWKVLIGAALVGIAATARDLCLDYVMERKAFGRPIGAFQSIQHGIADFPALIDGARTLVHKAAWALDGERHGAIDTHDFEIADRSVLASMAYCFAAEASAKVTDKSLHYHGSYGFSLEYDIQLYYRRARGWPLQLGDPATERARLADLLWPRDV